MDLNWAEIFAWPSLLKCFIVGGLLCVIGQILIDKTKLTPARILVIFVTTGAVLGGLGIYQYLVDFPRPWSPWPFGTSGCWRPSGRERPCTEPELQARRLPSASPRASPRASVRRKRLFRLS